MMGLLSAVLNALLLFHMSLRPNTRFHARSGHLQSLGLWSVLVASVCATPTPTSAVTAGTLSKAQLDQLFQQSPQQFPGPTKYGAVPFLAVVDPVPNLKGGAFVANAPLQLHVPVMGQDQGKEGGIWGEMGQLTPYRPHPGTFGVDEYALPGGSNISQVHILHRHGSRYPTKNADVEKFGKHLTALLANGSKNVDFSGNLSFIRSWSYKLGYEVLVPLGRQELYDSGVLHQYNYGQLYNASSKIVVRTTTQDRMLKSAQNFLAGFFGLDWTKNATLEPIIELPDFNNSLAGYFRCSNSDKAESRLGDRASKQWQAIYLQSAVTRFNNMTRGKDFSWNISSVYAAQTLCPYETVALGYSPWCQLFTYEEWQGFEYSIDLQFAGSSYFQSPTARAVGIGYVQELLARLQHRLLPNVAETQANLTLDTNEVTFPLNQSLYIDFSHDTNMASVLTALSLTQFQPLLPTTGPIPHNRTLKVSNLQPFAARFVLELIHTPHPVRPNRTHSFNTSQSYLPGNTTQYVHILLNQRTLPLHANLPQFCPYRADGWCELDRFLAAQASAIAKAQYSRACNANVPSVRYGDIMDGVPLS